MTPPPAGTIPTSPDPEQWHYLSDAWLAAADAALSGLAPLETELRIGFRVVVGPADDRTDDVTHQLVLGPGRVGIERGLDSVTITLTMTWDLATDIAQGRVSAQRAFLDGHIRLAGEPGALLGHQTSLAEIDDRLAELRARTIYDVPSATQYRRF